MQKENWLRTDELNEAIRDIEIVGNFLSNAISDAYYWKWIIIALHSALQGFMVCALEGSNGLNVLKDKISEKWFEAYRNGSEEYPIEQLDSFLNLYEKIKSDRIIMFVHSQKFCPQGGQDWSVKRLNQLRNEFIHFTPKGWSLEINGLPQIIRDCIAVIEFLVFESNNPPFIKENLLNEIRKSMRKIGEATYG